MPLSGAQIDASNELRDLLERKFPSAMLDEDVQQVMDSLFSEGDGNALLYEPMLELVGKYVDATLLTETDMPDCCTFHRHTAQRVAGAFCAPPNASPEIEKRLFVDLVSVVCAILDRHQVHKELYEQTSGRPEIGNYIGRNVSTPIKVSRLIPLMAFASNYLPRRPEGLGPISADETSLSPFGEWLAFAMDCGRDSSERQELLFGGRYGAPRGYWGAHIDTEASPGFASYCRHASAFCVLFGSIQNLDAYLRRDLHALFDELGVPGEQRRGHYVEATYHVPMYVPGQRSGLRTPGFLDAGGYPQWRPRGHTLALRGDAVPGAGCFELVHSPIRICRDQIDFRFWRNTRTPS
nr:hypothetical protein [uncultured Hyphomonas sp.]